MKTRMMALLAVLLLFSFVDGAAAQTADRLRIAIEAYRIRTDAGERRSNSAYVDAMDFGKTTSFGFYKLMNQCGLGVAPRKSDEPSVQFPNAEGRLTPTAFSWAVDVTPVRVNGEAITFRLQWTRSREGGELSTFPREDMELTLRPDESLPLDVVPRSSSTTGPDAASCTIRAFSLRVTITREPQPDLDRRLMAADIWLIERLPDGKERSQPLSLRGLYNQPIPFYFDTMTEGTMALDLFGEIRISPGAPTREVRVTTRSRVVDLKDTSPMARFRYYPKVTTATLRLAPDEVVSVVLPQVGDGSTDTSGLSGRSLSLRIRVHQLR